MLYEVITYRRLRGGRHAEYLRRHAGTDPGRRRHQGAERRLHARGSGPLRPASVAADLRRRITSYNVCYTKLLRIENQNKYNKELAIAAEQYPDIDPIIFKSLIAQESAFNPKAYNTLGYAGLTQCSGSGFRDSYNFV